MKKTMNCFNQEIKDILFRSSNIHKIQVKLEKLSCSNEVVIDVILECLATVNDASIANESFKQMLEFIKNNKRERSNGALLVALVTFAEYKIYMGVKQKSATYQGNNVDTQKGFLNELKGCVIADLKRIDSEDTKGIFEVLDAYRDSVREIDQMCETLSKIKNLT